MEKKDFFFFFYYEYSPILKEDSLSFLARLCESFMPKRVLEIGTYIGFSASVMLSSCACSLVTVEKNEENASLAKANLAPYGDRAKVVCADAGEFIKRTKLPKFDLIFLDGPKGQYLNYLPYLKKLLNHGGVLVADNVYFHGLVNGKEIVKHKLRTLVVNLRKFLDALKNDSDFETTVYDIGDGLSVSVYNGK